MSSLSAIKSPGDIDVNSLDGVVDEILAADEVLLIGRWYGRDRQALPSRAAVGSLMTELLGAMFPGHFGATDLVPSNARDYVGVQLAKVRVSLAEQIRRSLALSCEHMGIPSLEE